MSIQTVLLAVLVVVYGAAQYILAAQALRDLVRRPSVRGGNKTVWGIVILTIPIAGALLYTWMGPTSFLRRRESLAIQPRPAMTRRTSPAAQRKITPISTLLRPGAHTARRDAPRPPDPLRRTGS